MTKKMIKEYLVVGAGISGATFARLAAEKGIRVTVIDKASIIGGAMADEYNTKYKCFKQIYGPHIFHCNNERVWKFVNYFSEFNEYCHYVKTVDKRKEYPFPINFETISKVFGKQFFDEETVKEFIKNDIVKYYVNSDLDLEHVGSFEDQCISMVGPTIYKKFFKNYTEKQWKTPCNELPADLLKRVPIRYNFDSTYFQVKYQGQPKNGYTTLIKSILNHKNISVLLDTNFFEFSKEELQQFDKIIFTGDFSNKIPYRSTEFIMKEERPSKFKRYIHPVVNLPNHKEYTRRTDFNLLCGENIKGKHLVCYEKPAEINEFNKLYPISAGQKIYKDEMKKFLNKYNSLNIILLGRLAQYQYFDMDKAIENAFNVFEENEGKIKGF